MKKILTFLFVVMLVTTVVHATAGCFYTDFAVTNATGAISTAQHHSGVQSYDAMGSNNGSNPQVQITINNITNWTTITKVTMWVLTTAGWQNGQVAVNSSSPGWKSQTFSATSAGSWSQVTYDFSATPFASSDGWGQFIIQFYNQTGDLFIDELTFYDATGAVVWQVDASDVSTPPTSIAVSPGSATVVPGKNIQLSVTPTPSTAGSGCTYQSSDNTIATVSATGLVTSVAAGTATITATSSLDATVSSTATINVNAANIANSLVYDNFENGLGNYDGSWVGKQNTVAVNPLKSGIDTSNYVLKVDSNMQWDGLAFKATDLNKYNQVKFKIYTDSSDYGFQVGINNVANTSTSYTATAHTWTQLTYNITGYESSDQQIFFQRTGAGSAAAPGYTIYLDDITYIAGVASNFVPITGITCTNDTIKTDNGTLQIGAKITPDTATNKSLSFSLVNANQSPDTVTFSSTGLLTAVRNGKVAVKVVSADGGFSAIKNVVIKNQIVPVAGIKISGLDTVWAINGPAKYSASISPVDADTLTYKLSIADSLGAASTKASFNPADSSITALANGYVVLKAIAVGDTNIIAKKTIIIIYQQVLVDSVMITAKDSMIRGRMGSLQLSASVYPYFATNTKVIWSISDTTMARINQTGLVTALGTMDGIVWVKVTSQQGAKKDSIKITLTNQELFNLATFEGDAPAGDTIVTISGTKYLKVRLNAWNTDFSVAPIITSAFSTYKFSYIYDQDTSSVATSGVQAFIQFMNSSWGNKIAVTDKPASTTVKTLTGNLKADTISMLQLASQMTSGSWSAIAGPILYISQMQITTPFDLVTFGGDVPAGDTIVTISGAKYLKVRLNAWSTAFPIAPLTFYKNTTVNFSYKYDQDTSSVTAASVQAFVQFMKSGATAENIAITDKPASTTIKQLSAALKADTVNQLQLAAQLTSGSWSAEAGPVLYISQMTFTSPLDLTTMLGDIPAGATIVDTLNQRFLKMRLNAWSTAFPVAKMIFTANEKVTFSYKYAQDTSSVTAASVQAFVQFMMANATEENISITDKPASTTVKSITATLKADTINQLQLAAQLTSGSWSAVAGPILYVSQMVFTLPVTSIAISGGTAITTAGGTLTLVATITPTTAANKTVTWSVDNSAVATIDPKTGILTAVTNGTVVVTATANDGSKVKATASITVSGQVSVPILSAASISLYPNPVSDVLHLSNTSTVTRVEIYNTKGQVVLMFRNADAQMEINTAGLSNGIYFLRAYTGNNVIMKQFVK